jgi:hypothetical protein
MQFYSPLLLPYLQSKYFTTHSVFKDAQFVFHYQ